jgi:hypothetical protein
VAHCNRLLRKENVGGLKKIIYVWHVNDVQINLQTKASDFE